MLLRPLAIRRHGRDFELKLKGQPFLNPALARELREQFEITLDAEAFVALAHHERRVQAAARDRPAARAHRRTCRGSTSQPRLVVSSFAEVGPAMAADAASISTIPLIDALAGNTAARAGARAAGRAGASGRRRTSAARRPTPSCSTPTPSRSRWSPRSRPARRSSCKTLPGTGGTQTIVNAIGALVARGQARARRQRAPGDASTASPTASAHRPRRRGRHAPPGCAATSSSRSRRNEKAEQPQRRRRRRRARAPAQGAARLPLGAHRGATPSCTSRCSTRSASSHASRCCRHAAVDDGAPRPRLARRARHGPRPRRRATSPRAAELGEFRYGPGDSPWYGASFTSTDEATHAHALAKRLQRIGAAAAPRARPGADRADADAAVRDGRRARRVPAAAARHPRHARPVPARRCSTGRSASSSPRPRSRRDSPDMTRRQPPPAAPARARVRAARGARRRPARGAPRHPAAAHALAALRRGGRDARGAGRHRRRARRLPHGGDRPRGARRARSASWARRGSSPRARCASSSRTLAGLAAESEVLTNLQERTAVLVAAARPRPRPAARRPRAAARARGARSPPSSSSPGGSRRSSRCSPATGRCSARTPPCSTASRRDFRLVDEAHAVGSRTAARLAARRELEDRARRPARRGRPR